MRTFIFILIIFFLTTPNISNAQLTIIKGDIISSKNQCKALNKKRSRKSSKRAMSKKGSAEVYPISYNYSVISPERLAMERAQREEDLKRRQNEEPELVASTDTEFKFKTFQPDNSPPVDITKLPKPVNEKHAKIRKLVYDMIRQGKADQPITESLYFITAQDEFAYADFEPFLMAVEFALQGKMILVEGHTDNRGNDQYNLELSMKRVRQIERLMLEIGVPAERVSVIGYGESESEFDNATEEGMQKNRRVDFKIY